VGGFLLVIERGLEATKKLVHYQRKAGGRTPVCVAYARQCGELKASQTLPPATDKKAYLKQCVMQVPLALVHYKD
jgi:hypothetical protein